MFSERSNTHVKCFRNIFLGYANVDGTLNVHWMMYKYFVWANILRTLLDNFEKIFH